jgi:oxygen-dependent protoporphyrinogen oxidase
MGREFEHIVIGAGISGLGMAHRSAKRGVSTLVLEGSHRVGGCINSLTFPGCGGFWAEAGSHTCFNSYGHLLDTLTDLGLTRRLVPKARLRYSLWRGGERRSIFSALHPLELTLSLPRLLMGVKTNKGVAEFYGAGLGLRNYRDLFRPAFRAVICQEPDDFPADLLFRRKSKRKEVMRSFTFPGGLSDIPHAIAAQDALDVRTRQQSFGVSMDSDGFRVSLADGGLLRSRYLTLAVPPDVAAALLPQGMEELRTLLGKIGISWIETLVLCLPAGELGHLPPLAGLISGDDAFYSMVSRDYLPDERYRGFAFHFPRGSLDADAQVAHICGVLGIDAEKIAGLSRVSNRLPILRTGHQDLVQKIDKELAGGRLAIAGNWFLGVSIEDCLTRSHREFERLFPG